MSSTVTFLEQELDAAELAQSPKLLVPAEAIQYQGDLAFVFVVEEGVLRRLRVTLGEESDGRVEVIEGVRGGETIVSRAVGSLEAGQGVGVGL